MSDIEVVTVSSVPAQSPVAQAQEAPAAPSPADVKAPPLAETKGDAAPPQDDQDTDHSETVSEVQEPKKPRGVQKRIDELTREKNDLKRLLEQALTGKKDPDAQPQNPAAKDGPPRIEDFQDYDDYTDARAKYAARQEFLALQQRQSEQKAFETRNQAIAAFNSKAAKLSERVPGIEDSVAAFVQGQIPISDAAAYNLVEVAERGQEVMHYLAQNPQELARIQGFDPIRQVRELTLIEQRLSPLEPKRVTSANPPPNTVQAKAEVVKSPDQMNEDEYDAWFKQRKASGRN